MIFFAGFACSFFFLNQKEFGKFRFQHLTHYPRKKIRMRLVRGRTGVTWVWEREVQRPSMPFERCFRFGMDMIHDRALPLRITQYTRIGLVTKGELQASQGQRPHSLETNFLRTVLVTNITSERRTLVSFQDMSRIAGTPSRWLR